MLGEFLQAQLSASGPWNCSTMPADWCIALGHPDFAAKWRGVTDDAECGAVAASGLVALWDQGIGDALPVVATDPAPGDIAVIRRLETDLGAICTGPRWAIRTKRGPAFVTLQPSSILKAWRP